LGLLSIDIDGNDYWVWENIHRVNPIIVVTEYNAVFGDLHPISVPYDPAFVRSKAHHSHVYYGASLPAFIHLAEKKGYTFIGTNSHGVNAYFIRNSHAAPIKAALGEMCAYPSRFSDTRDSSGNLTFARGNQRLSGIIGLEVVNVKTGARHKIGDLGHLYSATWNE
jgi:hypothetical protein